MKLNSYFIAILGFSSIQATEYIEIVNKISEFLPILLQSAIGFITIFKLIKDLKHKKK